MIHLNRSLFFELHERAVALIDTLRVAGQFLVAVVRGLTSIKKMSTLWLGSRFLNWGFQLSFLWYQLLSSSYYQDQFALGFCCSQITSNFVSGSNPDNTALWSIAANTGKFRCGNRNPQSLCHCATPSSCLWCTQLLPNPPRGNRLPVWQLPSCILTGYSILSGPPSKGSAKTLVLMQWQAAEAKLQSPFHPSGVVPAAPGGQRSSQRSEQGAIPPCRPSSCFFRQSWTVSSVTCPRPPRMSTELGIGSMSPHSQAQGGQFWLFIFFKNKAFLPVGCWAPWHQPLQTAPASALHKNGVGTTSKWSKSCLLGHRERGFQSKQCRESVMQNPFSIPFLPTLSLCILFSEDVSPGCGLASAALYVWNFAAPRGRSAIS